MEWNQQPFILDSLLQKQKTTASYITQRTSMGGRYRAGAAEPTTFCQKTNSTSEATFSPEAKTFTIKMKTNGWLL